MSEPSLDLQTRKEAGTQVAKKLRREGKVPGTFYFHGEKSISFSTDTKALLGAINKESALINVTIDGKIKKKCIIREIQWHPITSTPLHIDLLGVSLAEKLTVSVQIQLTGTAFGVKTESGIMQQVLREVEIECLPSDIPEHISLDVSDLHIGDSLHLSAVSSESFKILGDPDRTVATVTAPRVVEVIEEVEEEETSEPVIVGRHAEDEAAE